MLLQYSHKNLAYFAKRTCIYFVCVCVKQQQWWKKQEHNGKDTKGKAKGESAAAIKHDRAAVSWEGRLYFPERLFKHHDTNVLPSFINSPIYLLIDCFSALYFLFVCLLLVRSTRLFPGAR